MTEDTAPHPAAAPLPCDALAAERTLVMGILNVTPDSFSDGGQHYAATDAIARPWNATLMVAFLIATFWHAQLGLQVILEDYVHTPLTAFVSQLLVRFVCFLGALASVFAVVRIALGN